MKHPAPEGSVAQCSPSVPAGTIQGFSRVLVLAGLVVLVAAGVFAWLYVKREQAEGRQAAEETLAAVADLKVAQITRWRQERLADARQIYYTPYAVRRALDVLAQPNSATTRQMLTGWLNAVLAGGAYDRALLLDDQLNVRLVHPESPVPPLAEVVRTAAARALRSREVALAELHRDSDDDHQHLTLIIPLLVRREGNNESVPAAGLPASPTDRSAGLLLLQVHADESLFPMIQAWPTPSPTAETLLVRRDGAEVVFLNAPRHRAPTNFAMLRLPLTQSNLPAALAVQGRAGTVVGVDYRGASVLATLRPVPNTSWAVVAKVDQTEVYARMRADIVMTLAIVGLVLLAMLLAFGLIWRQQALTASRHELAERQRAEETLRASEERYRSLFAANPQPMWVYDRETLAFLEVNDAAVFHYGYGREEFLRMTLRDIRPPEDVPRLLDDVQRLAPSLSDSGFWRHHKKSGEIMDVQIHSHGLEYNGRNARLVQVHNVTEQRRAEAALRDSEERYRLLLENSMDAILLTVPDGGVLQANRAACEMFGRTEAELRQTGRAGVVCEDDPRLPAALEERARTGRFVGELTLQRRDGTRFPAELSSTVFKDREGHIRASMIIRDITARQQAEAALRESEDRFKCFFDHSNVGKSITRATGELQANQAFCDLLGYSLAELQNRTWQSITHPDDLEPTERIVAALLSGQQDSARFTKRYLHKNGSMVWADVSTTLRRDATGQPLYFMTALVDITDRKRLEQERHTLEIQLRQQQRLESIGTLAGGVAHEINNPITGIMNYAQLIQDRLPPESPLVEFSTEIISETQRVAGIVRNLLTFARTEKQSHSPARMADIVDGVLTLIRTVIRHDDITLNVNVPDDLPSLRCRTQQIQQVLLNLMTNARDALNERYPAHDPDKVMSLTAGLFEADGHRWIRVTVEDHGTGITPEVRERMFDPFFTTKPRDVGTGLGLSISHGIVKEHEGRLTVESEPGRYTRMHLDLPV